MSALRWTVVHRKYGAAFFRPVAGFAGGTWHEARDLAGVLVAIWPDHEFWYVTAEGESTWPEDEGNILTNSGRRVKIRWGAKAQIDASEYVTSS